MLRSAKSTLGATCGVSRGDAVLGVRLCVFIGRSVGRFVCWSAGRRARVHARSQLGARRGRGSMLLSLGGTGVRPHARGLDFCALQFGALRGASPRGCFLDGIWRGCGARRPLGKAGAAGGGSDALRHPASAGAGLPAAHVPDHAHHLTGLCGSDPLLRAPGHCVFRLRFRGVHGVRAPDAGVLGPDPLEPLPALHRAGLRSVDMGAGAVLPVISPPPEKSAPDLTVGRLGNCANIRSSTHRRPLFTSPFLSGRGSSSRLCCW